MQLNVFGEKLTPCCLNPLTGWQRDGLCSFYNNDKGMHLVCVVVNAEFLQFSKSAGNDLSTATDNFPGLKPGDRWCLCVSRWLEAFRADQAPLIILSATSIQVLEYIPLPILQQMAYE